MSELVICLLQVPLRRDDESPLEATKSAIERMHQAYTKDETGHIDLFVLPELAPIGYSEHTFRHYLPTTAENELLYADVEDLMKKAAQSLKTHICYGTIGRVVDGSTSTAPSLTIRQVVVDPTGDVAVSYDKMHLCDYGDCAETRFFVPGRSPTILEVGSFRLGLLICADMRCALLCHYYTTQNVDVLLHPAAFARDISFRTYQSFRETRAVENGVYFCSVNYAGENYGDSTVVPPWVDEQHEPDRMDTSEGFRIARIQRDVLNQARSLMPFHRHVQAIDKSSCYKVPAKAG